MTSTVSAVTSLRRNVLRVEPRLDQRITLVARTDKRMLTGKGKQVRICGPDLLFLWWSCRESNPLLYQAICLLSCMFAPSRSGSVPVVTCGFGFGS
jgi:hypothetical protein